MARQTINYSFSVPNLSGITNYRVYGKTGAFVGATTVPDPEFLIANLDVNTTSYSYIPKETGIYYFRFYSFNSEAQKLSTGYATAQTTVTGIADINDVTISNLRTDRGLSNTTGIISGNYNKTDPVFRWQVASTDPDFLIDTLQYRITVREPSFSNTPSSTIYYETSEYANFEDPQFRFSMENNEGTSGGPHRNYDIVVEAYHTESNGVTSAGNVINTGYLATTENWSNPDGYDIFYLYSNKPTGTELTTGITPTGDTASLVTEQWIANNEIQINVISGSFSQDYLGGIIYYSKDYFSRDVESYVSGAQVASSGIRSSGVYSVEFSLGDSLNNLRNKIIVPTTLQNTGYICIGFYDAFDARRGNTEDEFGYNLSPTVPIFSSGQYNQLSITERLYFHQSGVLTGNADKMSYTYIQEDHLQVLKTYSDDIEVIVSSYSAP